EIHFDHVFFKYQKHYVIKDVNIRIPKGKMIAIVGESGGGKSTIVDLLPRFYDITKGRILLDGHDIREYKITDLRGLMGIVSQDSILFNDTVFNNIAFGMTNISQEAVEKAAKVANAHEFIIKMENGYQTSVRDRGVILSGGQRQRLSIARAVLANPDILILDEATSSLDTEAERLVQDALSKIMKNRTTLVIAHRLSTIRDADEIIVMQKGEIVERGSHKTLLKQNGIYKRLQDLQSFS
ncbi:Efflux ABC transporter, permease/ATP-binding protein, partial [hydrothermal vent metagenome]